MKWCWHVFRKVDISLPTTPYGTGTCSKNIRIVFQQICGDCHLLNFGGFASPERNLLFGINDFDETILAPFEWDLKRLVTSFVIAAREIGESDSVGLAAIEIMLEQYRSHLEEMTRLSALGKFGTKSIDANDLLASTQNSRIRRIRAKRLKRAVERTTASVLPKLTERDDQTGQRQLIDEPPLLWHPGKKMNRFPVRQAHFLPVIATA